MSVLSDRNCSSNKTGCSKGGSVARRLQTELSNLMMSSLKDPSISAFPNSENLFDWTGTIVGPKDTVYEDLKFKLSLHFPPDYPYKPPLVNFITPCFHPNVSTKGEICLDILQDKWSALYDCSSVLRSLQSLLGEPNNASPLNEQAANLWSDQKAFKAHVIRFYNSSSKSSDGSRS